MRIVFTQFTPPFEHGKSELEYLQYNDWFAQLRHHFSLEHEVVFISQTLKKDLISIHRDGYQSLFFPVSNPKSRQKSGQMRYESPAIENWLDVFKPDVVHVVGTNSEMARRVLAKSHLATRFLWERCTITEQVIRSQELALSDYYILPTEAARQRALVTQPEEKLLCIPLGIDTDTFRPLEDVPRQFHIASVGRLTSSKQYDYLRKVVEKRGLTWIHAGGILKRHPYRKWQDLFYSHNMRNLGLFKGPKISPDKKWSSGYYNHDVMPEFYNQAMMMVHPSRGEGAARAVQEAISCGLPVIALQEVVPWLEADFAYAIGDLSQLEEAIMALVDNPQKALKMGRKGRDWLIQNHAFPIMADAITEFHRLPKFR